jgi:hypothetical protein
LFSLSLAQEFYSSFLAFLRRHLTVSSDFHTGERHGQR